MHTNSNKKKTYLEKFLETISPLDHLDARKRNQVSQQTIQQVVVFFDQATVAFQQGNYAKAEQFYLHSLSILEEGFAIAPDELRSYLASALYNVGNTQKQLKKYAAATQHLTRATKMYLPLVQENSLAFTADLADAFLQLGQLQFKANNIDEAEKSLTSALIYFQQIGQPTLEQQQKIAHLTIKVAQVYEKKCQNEFAERNFRKGIGIYRRLALKQPNHFTGKLLETLGAFAKFFEDRGESEKAIFIHLDIIKTYQNSADCFTQNNQEKIAGTLTWVAVLWTNNRKPENAVKYFLQAIPIWKTLSDIDFNTYFPMLIKALYNVGVCYNNLVEKEKAFEYFKLTLEAKLQLAKVKPKENLPAARQFINDFSTILKDFHQIEKLTPIFEKALQTITNWTYFNANDWFLLEIAAWWKALGCHFLYILDYEKTRIAIEKSLEIKRELCRKDSAKHEESLVETLMKYIETFYVFGEGTLLKTTTSEVLKILDNKKEDSFYIQCKSYCLWSLSVYYQYAEKEKDVAKAETLSTEALHLMKTLAGKNPDIYLTIVFEFINRLADVKVKNKKEIEAEQLIADAQELLTYLEKNNAAGHESRLGYFLLSSGNFATLKKNYEVAEKSFLEALEISKKSAKKRPWEDGLTLANNYHVLAILYQKHLINPEKSLAFAQKSLSVYVKYKDKLKCANGKYQKVQKIVEFWKQK